MLGENASLLIFKYAHDRRFSDTIEGIYSDYSFV